MTKAWKPDVELAIQACRDESLSDGACRFAVLSMLVEPKPLSQIDIEWAQREAAGTRSNHERAPVEDRGGDA